MNTILHLVRKDFLARRGVILIWLLVLLLGLLRDLGWVEIHARDDAGGRFVPVQGHATVAENREGLFRSALEALIYFLTGEKTRKLKLAY